MKEVKNFQKSLLRNRWQIYKFRVECLIWTMKNIPKVLLFASLVKSIRGSLVVKTWCHTYPESLDVMSDFETPRQKIQSGQEMMTRGRTALEQGTELHHPPLQAHQQSILVVRNPTTSEMEVQAFLNWGYREWNPRKAVCEVLSFCQVFYSSLLYTFFSFPPYLDSFMKSQSSKIVNLKAYWRKIKLKIEEANWDLAMPFPLLRP